MLDILKNALQNALTDIGLHPQEFVVEPTDELSFGDAASNVALVHAKLAKKSPRELADDIAERLVLPEHVRDISVEGPGFINFHYRREYFAEVVRDIGAAGESWGASTTLSGKKVFVEHTQPNPFKPFHIGHLMSSTLGESIACLVENAGAEVRRANWQGDVGLHVAKALWGLKKTGGNPHDVNALGEAYVVGNNAYEDDEAAQSEIKEINKQVYENAAEVRELYDTGRSVSLAHFEELYALLNTRFDHYFFESEGVKPGKEVVEEGRAKGVFEESDGAVVFRGEEHGLHTRVFMTKEGLPTYETKELGLAVLKENAWPEFEISITTTAVEQNEYFKVVLKALSLVRPELARKLVHVSHGMMVLTSGKMSSRKGNIVTGEELLRELIERVRDKMADRDFSGEEKHDIARAIAVAAVKYTVLRQSSGKNITFDPDASLSLDGASGPYLLYAYTRARSIARKAEEEGVTPGLVDMPSEVPELERILWRFPQVALRAMDEYEPHYVTTYLTELASAFNTWYAREQVIDGTKEAPYKLALTNAFATTMHNGLKLLGIRTVEKM